MNQDQRKIPIYKIRAITGILIGILGAFAGVWLNIPMLVPLALLIALFSIGYHIQGQVKDGFKWAGIFLVFLVAAVLISYINN